jgi:hypothetical protein
MDLLDERPAKIGVLEAVALYEVPGPGPGMHVGVSGAEVALDLPGNGRPRHQAILLQALVTGARTDPGEAARRSGGWPAFGVCLTSTASPSVSVATSAAGDGSEPRDSAYFERVWKAVVD